MAQVGGGENAMNAEPQLVRRDGSATRNDAIGFMKVGEDQIEWPCMALTCGDDVVEREGPA